MFNGRLTACVAAAIAIGACAKAPRPLPGIVDAKAVEHCAFIGRTVGDAATAKDKTPVSRSEREEQARMRAAALGGTHVVWDTSGNFHADAVAAKVYRCNTP
jgi:hypothetical protein